MKLVTKSNIYLKFEEERKKGRKKESKKKEINVGDNKTDINKVSSRNI
jgi:hypothetical protein